MTRPRSKTTKPRAASSARLAALEVEVQDLREQLDLERIHFEAALESVVETRRELEISHARYADLYDSAPVGYVFLDHNGFMYEANGTLCTMLGMPRERLHGMLLSRFVLKEDSRTLLRHLSRCRHSAGDEDVTTELTIIGGEGQLRDIILMSRTKSPPAKSDKKARFRTALVDIIERKRAEEALRESEERLLLALESANMGTWEWDAENDSLLCNHWQAALFGARPGDFPCTGAEALSRIHADDRARICTVVRKVLEEVVTVREEFRVVHADGSVRWLFGSGRPVQDEHCRGRHVVGVCLDITERRQDHEKAKDLNEILETRVRERAAQLVEANERWDWVVRATNDAIWDWDLVHDTAYFSPRWKEMHGFQASDQPESREDWQRRIHPEDQAAILAGLEAYLHGEKETFSEEYRIQRKDGTYFWVFDRGIAIFNEQGRAVRMVGAETDITWRKGIEQTLRFREQQFRTLADNVPALFAYIDRDRRYQFVNKQYEHLFRRPDEEITGMSISDLLGPESYAEVRFQLDKALLGKSVSFEYELKLLDGSRHFLSARYVPDWNDRGEVIGVFALSADITVLKSKEELLREREAQLRELGVRLLQAQEEERRRISRDLHDDVMQRMGALTLELYSLASSNSSHERELLSQIKVCGASAEQLTTDLQRMAHQLHPSVLEFGGLEMAVREQVNDFGTRTGLSAELIMQDVPRDIPLDHATCLYRVLQEGLHNVQKHANATTVLVRLLRTGQGLELSIHDDGRGMESIDGTVRRRGLGLTSMAERIGMLSGRFRIQAVPNDGTELHAWVPLEESKCET